MKFLDYIKGKRKGKDAQQIEKESMRDPFLFDAIEGFDSVEGNHIANIERLRTRIRNKPKGGSDTVRRHPLWQAAAACGIVIFAVGGYLFINHQQSMLHAQESANSSIIDIYVPEVFYEENTGIIEEKNVVLANNYKPAIEAFKAGDNMSTVMTEEELEILANDRMAIQNQEVIDIYIPEEYYKEAEADAILRSKDTGKPEPIGGFDKYNAYLKANLKHPTDGICAERHGKVAVEFSVDEHGSPYQFVVIYSLCGTSDKEAIRLIKNGPKWAPTKQRVVVKVEF